MIMSEPKTSGWISVKDKEPVFPCVLGYWNGTQWLHTTAEHMATKYWTHWMPLPPPPPDPDEQAFDELQRKPGFEVLHDEQELVKKYFIAGIKAERERGKK